MGNLVYLFVTPPSGHELPLIDDSKLTTNASSSVLKSEYMYSDNNQSLQSHTVNQSTGTNHPQQSAFTQGKSSFNWFSNWFNIGTQVNDKVFKKEDIDNTNVDKDKDILISINDKNSETEKNDNDDNLISTRKNHSSALGSTTKKGNDLAD